MYIEVYALLSNSVYLKLKRSIRYTKAVSNAANNAN